MPLHAATRPTYFRSRGNAANSLRGIDERQCRKFSIQESRPKRATPDPPPPAPDPITSGFTQHIVGSQSFLQFLGRDDGFGWELRARAFALRSVEGGAHWLALRFSLFYQRRERTRCTLSFSKMACRCTCWLLGYIRGMFRGVFGRLDYEHEHLYRGWELYGGTYQLRGWILGKWFLF